jgi:aminopeptidase N
LYVDRREAIDFAATKQNDDPKALDLLKSALKDRFPGLRVYTIQKLNIENESVKNGVESLLADMAKNDPKSLVRAEAIKALGKCKKEKYKELYLKSINDSSYSIAGNALLALDAIDSAAALKQAIVLSAQPAKGTLSKAINNALFKYSGESEFDMLAARFENLPSWKDKYDAAPDFANFLKRVNNTSDFRKGIDMIASLRDSLPEQDGKLYLSFINGWILNSLATAKQSSGMTEQADYVTSKLPVAKERITFEVPMETLLKYPGEYNYLTLTINIILKEGKILNFILEGQPAVELIPVSKNKFVLKFMEDQSIEFIYNEKDEVTAIQLIYPGGQLNAAKKK